MCIKGLLPPCCQYDFCSDTPDFEADITMPTYRFDSWDDDARRDRSDRRMSRQNRPRMHPDPSASELKQESEDVYGPPEKTKAILSQMILADRRLTLRPLSQLIEDRRDLRARNPRSASSPVRQKHIYPTHEALSTSSAGQNEDSASLVTSDRGSRYDAETRRHETMKDADSRNRSRTQRGEEERAAPNREPARRKLTPSYPPSSYPAGRHKRSHKKSEPYPSSVPSAIDTRNLGPNLKSSSRTGKGSYRESIEDLITPSQSEYTPTDVTETMTDLPRTEGNTEYATSYTESTMGRDHFQSQEARDSAECDPSEFSVDTHLSRSEVDPYLQERFFDLMYICPEDFRTSLQDWQRYETSCRKVAHPVTQSQWLWAQRESVKRHFRYLDRFHKDCYSHPFDQ